jgi:glycosyltransferase involved in cell wall biosynthesis
VRAAGTPLVLGVRQDYRAYIRRRLPSRKWFWAVGVAAALDGAFRRLARTAPTIALGDEIARAYAGGPAPVLSTGFSLVPAADVVDAAEVPRPLGEELRVLTVSRLDPEKNPLLLVEIMRRLRQRDPRWRLTIVGDGPLRGELDARIAAAGLDDAIDRRGYVAQGEALRTVYREHDVFLHVSLTEGLPQVVFEAQAAGLPLVATTVGGVRAALEPTGSALLIPPRDPGSAVAALRSIAADESIRRTLVARGLSSAAENTTESQVVRIVSFLQTAVEKAHSYAK